MTATVLFRGVSLFVEHEDRVEVLLPVTAPARGRRHVHTSKLALWRRPGVPASWPLASGVRLALGVGNRPAFTGDETPSLRSVAGMRLKGASELSGLVTATIVLRGGAIRPSRRSPLANWRFGTASYPVLAFELAWDSGLPSVRVEITGGSSWREDIPDELFARDTIMIGNRCDADVSLWHPENDERHERACDDGSLVDEDFGWLYGLFDNVPPNAPLPEVDCIGVHGVPGVRGAGSPTCFQGRW